ncbi:hypothetical protein M6B38_317570 [Iris pallida]|uniref:Uncharacterized protein n=1 Tax=Iris pallida TaxID=29817 RepID=A0AAX6DQ22_IRIPA|nr:hypothetical protein M6B38_233100 [Iris pallida]KAJ6799102.1 hypothetical protein M6B38_209465 [Iris pallida]KAJ6818198.1 hypothetical protein M6B38_407645 [Iris pallida]KAJ6838895.1 hypothetical protein M6B38_317570 [Iris pallida]
MIPSHPAGRVHSSGSEGKMNNEAIAAHLSFEAVKPTLQSFFLSQIMDLWCQWSKGSGGQSPLSTRFFY